MLTSQALSLSLTAFVDLRVLSRDTVYCDLSRRARDTGGYGVRVVTVTLDNVCARVSRSGQVCPAGEGGARWNGQTAACITGTCTYRTDAAVCMHMQGHGGTDPNQGLRDSNNDARGWGRRMLEMKENDRDFRDGTDSENSKYDWGRTSEEKGK